MPPPVPPSFNYPSGYPMPSPSGPPNLTPNVGGFDYQIPTGPTTGFQGYPPPQGPPSSNSGFYPPPQGPPQGFPSPNSGFYPPPPQGPPPQVYPPQVQGYPPPVPPQQMAYTSPPQDPNRPTQYLSAPLLNDPRNPYPPPLPSSLPNYPPDRITADVNAIKSATKGFGTDENMLSRVLFRGGPREWREIEILKEAWKRREGKDLEVTLKSELSGWLEFGLVGRVKGPVELDLLLIEKACSGAGTKEVLLTEVLIGRDPNDMNILQQAYKIAHKGKSLEDRLKSELSLKTERMFLIAIRTQWEDLALSQSPSLLTEDIQSLQTSLRTGATDEMKVCSILLNRSPQYLNQLQSQFLQFTGNSLTKEIKKHFSGHMESALLFAVEGGKRDINGAWRSAKMLEKSMKGFGTKDEQLVYRLLRSSWNSDNLENVKNAYRAKYKKSLGDRVKGETSGKYRDMLLILLGDKS